MRDLYRDGFDYLTSRPDVAAALLLGGLVLGALALLAAQLFGWGRLASVLAGVSLALALSVTLVRPFWGDVRLGDPLRVCVPGVFSVTGSGVMLNFVMLMPLAFFGVLATKRPLLVALGCVSVSAGIEISQAVFELGVCDGQDFLNNTVGAALAALVGWLLLLTSGRGRHQTRHREPQAGPTPLAAPIRSSAPTSFPVSTRSLAPTGLCAPTRFSAPMWSPAPTRPIQQAWDAIPAHPASDHETVPLVRETTASGAWFRP